jgi:hypothetical protein
MIALRARVFNESSSIESDESDYLDSEYETSIEASATCSRVVTFGSTIVAVTFALEP